MMDHDCDTDCDLVVRVPVRVDPAVVRIPTPGARGKPGLSAYEVWLGAGNVGDVGAFLDSLKGPLQPPSAYPINGAASFTAAHGKAFAPDIWILTPSGELVETDVLHAPGATTVVFPEPFTGTLYLR